MLFLTIFAQKGCSWSKTRKGTTTTEECRVKNKSNVPTELISSNQTAYVKNLCISESGNLISDVIDKCDILHIPCYHVTMDQDFLLFALKNLVFGENFTHWINVLLNKQQSCLINEDFTSRYFNLEKGARQGDPILAYLLILASDVLFELIKNNDDKEE